MHPLVSTAWLAEHLDAPDIRILDASWYLPSAERDPRDEYKRAHIPGAIFFDIDAISDTENPLPHMLPSPESFSSRVSVLGISNDDKIIVYDSAGIFSAPRVWWMFRVMGHEDVVVLDGGLKKWKAEGLPVTDMTTQVRPRHYTARRNSLLLRDKDSMLHNLETWNEQVIDARSSKRFRGEEPEPRPGLRSGHIPGSCNLPFGQLVNMDGTMKPVAELRRLFEDASIDLNRPIVTSCGSGVTAAVLALGLAVLGRTDIAIYDGSWAEWGTSDELPIEP